MEWCSILIERKEKAKLEPPAQLVKDAQVVVDTFRVANALDAKYAEKEKDNAI